MNVSVYFFLESQFRCYCLKIRNGFQHCQLGGVAASALSVQSVHFSLESSADQTFCRHTERHKSQRHKAAHLGEFTNKLQ